MGQQIETDARYAVLVEDAATISMMGVRIRVCRGARESGMLLTRLPAHPLVRDIPDLVYGRSKTQTMT